MRRFVEHFYPWNGQPAVEDQINDYAEKYNLTIITIAPMYQNGIYVLFQEREEAEMSREQIDNQAIEEMARILCEACASDPSPCRLVGEGKMCEGVLKTAEVSYNAGYRKQEWISVEERLPETNVECLVAAKVGNGMVVDLGEYISYINNITKEQGYEWMITNDWDEGEGCEITHWMPLPEPPKMKDGE